MARHRREGGAARHRSAHRSRAARSSDRHGNVAVGGAIAPADLADGPVDRAVEVRQAAQVDRRQVPALARDPARQPLQVVRLGAIQVGAWQASLHLGQQRRWIIPALDHQDAATRGGELHRAPGGVHGPDRNRLRHGRPSIPRPSGHGGLLADACYSRARMTSKTKVPYRCSFCGKSQEQVRKLIAGQGVYICDECINLCQEIIEEEMLEAPRAGRPPPPRCPARARSRSAWTNTSSARTRPRRSSRWRSTTTTSA